MSAAANSPLFTIVVPTFGRERHIGRCLRSIARQSFQDYDAVVVDNNSTDRTVELALAFRGQIKMDVLVNDSNCERSYSRNRGAEHAAGQFVVFLDSDDELTEDSLERAAAFIEEGSDRRFFFQKLKIIDEMGNVVYEPAIGKRHSMCRTLAEGNPLSCSGVFVERSLFLAHRFDETPELVGSEDWHCWIRIATDHEPMVCPGGGALLLDHSSRTITSDTWQEAEERFAYLTSDLLADRATSDYLAPYLGLFHGSQSHYVAVKAANQSDFQSSVSRFGRAIHRSPSLLFSRRTMHLFRLWLRHAFGWRAQHRDV